MHLTSFQKMDLEKTSIERIKLASELSLHYYGQPLVCTYSGGKDSDVLLELFRRSGVPYEVHNSHTTVDAPPTVYHIRQQFAALEQQGIQCTIQKPVYQKKPITMWTLIPMKKIPPTRRMRYCCAVLKETACQNRYIATGVRWAESRSRQKRQAYETYNTKKVIRLSDETMLLNDNDNRALTEHCQLKGKMIVNPIIDWTDADVWEYIRAEKLLYNPLYDRGYFRVGCIGCPIAGRNRRKEFADYPTYQQAYIRAFNKMLEMIKNSCWKSGEEVFRWWMEEENIEGQMSLVQDPDGDLTWD